MLSLAREKSKSGTKSTKMVSRGSPELWALPPELWAPTGEDWDKDEDDPKPSEVAEASMDWVDWDNYPWTGIVPKPAVDDNPPPPPDPPMFSPSNPPPGWKEFMSGPHPKKSLGCDSEFTKNLKPPLTLPEQQPDTAQPDTASEGRQCAVNENSKFGTKN